MGNKALKSNQKGLVSFTVVIVIMIVVTLLVTSFALVVRREQRRSLDRQLSMQAFYAAESGIRQAQTFLTGVSPARGGINECTGENSFVEKINAEITKLGRDDDKITNKVGENSEYSCLLIDVEPESWQMTSLQPTDGPVVIPIKTNGNIRSLRIGWQASDGESSFDSPLGKFPGDFTLSSPTSLNTPVVKAILMPYPDGTLSASDINDGAHTIFLYPKNEANNYLAGAIEYKNGGVSWGYNNTLQGALADGNCNINNRGSNIGGKSAKMYCNVDINGLNGDNYILVVQSLYKGASIDVQGFNAGNNNEALRESQAIIDVTGKATDVIRRISVRIPFGDGYKYRDFGESLLPLGAIETTDDICKRLKRTNTQVDNVCTNESVQLSSVMNGGSVWGDANVEEAPSSGTYTTNPANYYAYSFNLYNRSSVSPGTLESCTWDWGDGVVQVLDDTHPWCQNGAMGGHNYPDTRGLINRTYGTDGCYMYTFKLTNTFTAASGLLPAEDTMIMYPPRGIANDPPNPTTGVGICNGRYKNAPAPPVPADTTPSDPPACYLVFPVTPVIGGKGPNPCP
jgi:hypothetical protein